MNDVASATYLNPGKHSLSLEVTMNNVASDAYLYHVYEHSLASNGQCTSYILPDSVILE